MRHLKAAALLVVILSVVAATCKPAEDTEGFCSPYDPGSCGTEDDTTGTDETGLLAEAYVKTCQLVQGDMCGCWWDEDVCPSGIADCEGFCMTPCEQITSSTVAPCVEKAYAGYPSDWDAGLEAVRACVASETCGDYLDRDIDARIANCVDQVAQAITPAFMAQVAGYLKGQGCPETAIPSLDGFWANPPADGNTLRQSP